MTAIDTWKKIQKICRDSTGREDCYSQDNNMYRIETIELKSSMDSAYKEIRAAVYLVDEDTVIKKIKPGIHISMLGDVVKYPTIFLKLIKKLRFTEV